MSDAAVVAVSQAATVPKGWIHSPAYDLALFTLSPIAGVIMLWANAHLSFGPVVVLASVYLVGIPHYLATFTFFLGDDNLAYYRSRWAAFFVGPVVIFTAVVILRAIRFDPIVLNAMFLWNIWHVSLQSAGILSLYRRLNGGPPSERSIAHAAILSVNATCALWNVDRYPPLYDVLTRFHPMAPLVVRVVTLPVAIGTLGVLAWKLARRPKPVSVPESAFLASSLALFHPYLWVRDSNLATLAMLMGHFIQYLAIVWLLHARKYGASMGSLRERLLGNVGVHPPLVIGVIVAMGIAFYGFNKGATMLGAPMVYLVTWNAMTLVHFYLDGLIWAFKRPFVRESIGPYLTPSVRIVSS